MYQAFLDAREDSSIGVVYLPGGLTPMASTPFVRGDQSVAERPGCGRRGVPRLNVLFTKADSQHA